MKLLPLHLFFALVTTSVSFTAFTPFASSPKAKHQQLQNQRETVSSTQLFYTDDDNNNNSNNNNNNQKKAVKHDSVRRTAIKGISVSPSGFLTLLETRSTSPKTPKIILPIRMTSTSKDAFATTTAESLTICQLLSGVDMAGAILSPDVLKHIVGLYCSSCSMDDEEDDDENDSGDWNPNQIIIEDELGLEMPIPNSYHEEEEEEDIKNDDYAKKFVHDFIKTSLGPNTNSFEEASTYQRSRVIFPKISLDSIRIDLPTTMTSSSEFVSSSRNLSR